MKNRYLRNMEQELISIITPFKNTESFLAECVQSIINQCYTNWELLIVDDGSTDASYRIVSAFAKNDRRIKLYKNPGTGIISALQYGFSNSRGTFITRMDSDDVMTPNKLAVLAHNLKTFGKGHVAVGQVRYFRKDGLSLGYKSYQNWLNSLTQTGNNYSEIYKECVIPSPCWMVYRQDFINCNAFNNQIYPEDYDLAFRFYENQLTIIPCSKKIHLWRDYSTRTSRTHEHYAENHFLPLKLKYYLKLDYNPKQPLVIWGAGKKGKTVAKLLLENAVNFIWICDNSKKIGKEIYGIVMHDISRLKTLTNPQCLITVANKAEQKTIQAYLQSIGLLPSKHYFFLC
ncbi:glycosyltransferase [Bizionia sediminis]|uniref:Glycosyltransferase n=1 Tax=Bizionia sediminis TaxID=1737064 RepID=A0ABW5KPY0_9FLAO